MRRLLCLLTFLLPSLATAQMNCDTRSPVFAKYEKLPITDGWFEVYRLPGNVFALWEPRQSQRVFSYLILGDKRALLFDTGLGIGRIDKVVAQLTQLPVTVLNSHTHHDHMGGNYAFADVMAVDSDFTRKNAQGYPNSVMQSELASGQFCAPLPDGIEPSNYVGRPFKIAKTVRDGEIIDLGGRKLEVLLTPGHTPDALCLLDRSQRELFTGDTYYPGSLWLWAPETDLDAYQRSIERLAKLAGEVNVLRPAHNLPEADPANLAKVAALLPEVRAGRVPGSVRGERKVFRQDGISITLANTP